MPNTQERAAEITKANLAIRMNLQVLEHTSQIITGQSKVKMRKVRRTCHRYARGHKRTNAKTYFWANATKVTIHRVRDKRLRLHKQHNGGTTSALLNVFKLRGHKIGRLREVLMASHRR